MDYLTLSDFVLHYFMKIYATICKGLKADNEFETYENLKNHQATVDKIPEL